jgi:hypothetical protein
LARLNFESVNSKNPIEVGDKGKRAQVTFCKCIEIPAGKIIGVKVKLDSSQVGLVKNIQFIVCGPKAE